MDRFNLKPMSAEAIPSAIAKAERYRLLNEPGEAESICLDVLQIDPHNEDARVMLLLALTDQFPHDTSARFISRANDLAASLDNDYDRAYYSGIVRERRAKAVLQRDRFGATAVAIEWLREAMALYERAESVRPAHNDDSLLRWNACARLLAQLPEPAADLHEPEPLQLE
jgi:tetratricopeptide (TPR) repeat protein